MDAYRTRGGWLRARGQRDALPLRALAMTSLLLIDGVWHDTLPHNGFSVLATITAMNNQRYIGRIVTWKAQEKYGFIQSPSHPNDIFFHINQCYHRDWLPQIGELVRFEVGQDAQGRLQAINVESQSPAPRIAPPRINPADTMLALLVCAAFITLLGLATVTVGLPVWVIGWYLAASVVTLMLYIEDKQRAQRGVRRIREKTLHRWELLGGWPGALIGQELVRHKVSKGSYTKVFWLIVGLHLLGLIGYIVVRIGLVTL
ncbi:hypothetical protein A6A03_00095 [Chloroflexus islandicus]|uniref:CSD domain-containing protein n=2 Tax=Chloroflexus islandicus TaxID=1707952 RepID=A0A178MF39_9CHLR|nr:hypothetical protein A6A03_00095 [Chloroflexus islandicus]